MTIKKCSLFISLLILSLGLIFGCARQTNQYQIIVPRLTSIQFVDRNGFSETISTPDRLETYENVNFLTPQSYQKVLRIYERDCAGNITSFLTTYYPNGQVKQYLESINNRALGSYQEWYENGQKKISAIVIGGMAELDPESQSTWLFDGESCAWDEQGHIIALVNYQKGQQEGPALYYYPSGQLKEELVFSKGLLEGCSTRYRKDGTIEHLSNFCAGLPQGEVVSFYPNGTRRSLEHFDQGLLVEGTYWNEEGQTISTIQDGFGKRIVWKKDILSEKQTIQHGLPYGKIELFDTKGKLTSYYTIQEGEKNGEEVVFYPSGKPKLSLEWVKGQMQGTVKTWYPNGQLESQKELSQNQKEGLNFAWYLDGTVMLAEEYNKDRLIKGQYFKRGQKDPISTVKDGKGFVNLFDPDGRFLQKIEYDKGSVVVK